MPKEQVIMVEVAYFDESLFHSVWKASSTEQMITSLEEDFNVELPRQIKPGEGITRVRRDKPTVTFLFHFVELNGQSNV